MKTRKYENPEEAFEIMNNATEIKTSYKTQFLGKKITRVDIDFEGDKPVFAHVHYSDETHVGIENFDLTKKLL